MPLLGAFGAHFVDDVFETAYAFHTFGSDKLLWSDMHGTDIFELTLYKNITLFVRNLSKINSTVKVVAENIYSNFTFDIDLNFWKDKDDDDDKTKKEILWIGIIGIASVMIIGLLIAWCKQKKTTQQ